MKRTRRVPCALAGFPYRGLPLLALLVLVLAVCLGGTARAQSLSPERSGFTLLLSLGVGIQKDQALDSSETGLSGLNLGIGGFLNEDLALTFRASGTNVDYGSNTTIQVNQISGVGGPALQYWVNDRFNVEGGAGLGFWRIEGARETGLGLILGAGYAFFNRGKHNLQLGVEYAPAFTDPDTVHNFGIALGYQLL